MPSNGPISRSNFANGAAFLILAMFATGIALLPSVTATQMKSAVGNDGANGAIVDHQMQQDIIKERFLRYRQLHYGTDSSSSSSASSAALLRKQFRTYARMRRTKRRRRTSRHSSGISRVLVETANCEHVELVDCGDYWDKGMRCMMTATGMPCCICNGRLRFRRRKLRHHHHHYQQQEQQWNDDVHRHPERDNNNKKSPDGEEEEERNIIISRIINMDNNVEEEGKEEGEGKALKTDERRRRNEGRNDGTAQFVTTTTLPFD